MTFTVPVTLVARTVSGRDSYGNDVAGTVESTVGGVYAPGLSSEVVGGRDTVTTQSTVYLPAGVDVSAVDGVRVGGLLFEVDGDPADWSAQPNPFSGWVPDFPVIVKLKRVEG